PMLPVLGVNFIQADCFAQWLVTGGALPTKEQWEKDAVREPPLLPEDSENPPGGWVGFAIDRLTQGPLPVGQAERDVSKCGCRDMGGNGCEWTRSLRRSGKDYTRTETTSYLQKEEALIVSQ